MASWEELEQKCMACTGCGLCAEKCPLGNIELTDGLPHWGEKCTQCMACICLCEM